MKFFKSIFFLSLISVPVFASGDIQVVFEALKNSAVDYGPSGQVCEQVARLQFAEKYTPDRYEITGGLEYKVQNRTIGELDLVIFEKQTHNVVLVGEVKCWKRLGQALEKAHDQRSRFLKTLNRQGSEIVFASKEGQTFEAAQFDSPEYVSIAQEGSESYGFDVDLNYSLHDLMKLREMLISCQTHHQCPQAR